MKLLTIVFIIFFVSTCFAYESQVTMYVPAVENVDGKQRGVLAVLHTSIRPGNGHIFVDTLPLTEIDTQAGARMAREAVESILDIDLYEYDLFFVIRSDAPVVGGPSASGAMAAGIVASLLNLSIDTSVVMTGTINTDGSIGHVSGLIEKAQAVAEHNGTIFLIPEGQRIVYTQIGDQSSKIDLKEYAMEKWNLSVIEVKDIKEAIKYMTGYEIKFKETELKEDKKIKEVMKGLATDFINEIENKINTIKNKIKVARLSYTDEQEFNKKLEEQEEKFKEAKDLYKNESYYSASSYCFSISIQLTSLENMLEFIGGGQKERLLENMLMDTNEKIKQITDKIEDSKSRIDNVTDIEIISIAEERISESKNYLKDAWKNFYNAKYVDSIYHLSYASERAKTAERWLSLTASFIGHNLSFDFSKLDGLTQDRISEATSLVAYAQVLNIDATTADKFLKNAKEDYENKLYSSALFNAISSKSEIDIAMIRKNLNESKLKESISKAKNDAIRNIKEAYDYGINPILAVNYYEYAESLSDTDPIASLTYLIYAKNFAKTSKNLLKVYKGVEFGFKIEKIEITPTKHTIYEEKNYYVIFGFFFVGLVIGFIISQIYKKRYKKQREHKVL
ncbi:MAG: S16 family serine protease [Candidatus Aenigmatarchaeota archaeon]